MTGPLTRDLYVLGLEYPSAEAALAVFERANAELRDCSLWHTATPDLSRHFLVTAAQFSRPERGLVVPDTVLMPVDVAAFLAGQGVTYAFGEEPNLSYLAYRHRTSAAKNFRAGSDWRIKQPYSGRVIRRVREETQ